MAIPFTLPLQSQTTEENKLATIEDVKTEVASAILESAGNYATAEQGQKADTALQNNATGNNLAIGDTTAATGNYATAIGYGAISNADGAIQLGQGTNNTAGTLCIALGSTSSKVNYTLLDTNGMIPVERLAEIMIVSNTAPTTSTVGALGDLYKDTSTGTIYKCTVVDSSTPSYTWSEFGGNVDLSGYLQNNATGSEGALAIGNSSTGSGRGSTAIGAGSSTTEAYSVAVGHNAKANGGLIAIGNEATASSINAMAFGFAAKATGVGSLAVGQSITASGGGAITIGSSNKAGGSNSISVGGSINNTSGQNSVRIGYNTSQKSTYDLTGNYGVGIGYNAYTQNQYGIAIGANANVKADYGIQLGRGSNSDANTFKVGLSDTLNVELLSADGTIPAERLVNAPSGGLSNNSTDDRSLSVGENATASDPTNTVSSGSTAFGYEASANHKASTALGAHSSVSDSSGTAVGSLAESGGSGVAVGWQAFAHDHCVSIGHTAASQNGSLYGTAVGYSSFTSDDYCVALGSEANAYGVGSIAIGSGASALDSSYDDDGTANTIVIGHNASSGKGCITIGEGSNTASLPSFPEDGSEPTFLSGENAIAIGKYAKAAGKNTIQLGSAENTDAGTFKVCLGESDTNYMLLDAGGKIPAERLPEQKDLTTSNNVFTGSNTFQGPVVFENQPNINIKTSYIELWNMDASWNIAPTSRKSIAYSFKDKNGTAMGSLALARETNGDTTISLHVHAQNGSWSQPGQVLSQIAKADGTLESRASEPPSDANDSRIATCKFVNDKINAIPGALTGTTPPTTSTAGSIGKFYVDTTNGEGYMCVSVSDSTYTWKKITYSPVGTEYILEAGNWNTENNSIEISIPGLTIGTPMWIAPTVSEDNSNETNYVTHSIRLKAQQVDSITLSCTIIPTENISITIIK